MAVRMIKEFLRLESAAGIVLVIAAAVAMLIANTPLAHLYHQLLELEFSIKLGNIGLEKELLHWINDGLMAIFFLLIGMELKREVLQGELSSFRQISLPAFAAVGGMLGPALVYYFFNSHDKTALQGWAIPTATDIAFALGVLSLLGSRVPLSLKVFLTALAVLDDLGAIIVIALFYTKELSGLSLGLAGGAMVVLVAMNLLGVKRVTAFALVGTLMWIFVLKSGIHATLAGVITGLCIPLHGKDEDGQSPLIHLEHLLHPWVAFLILPVFAFANAGVGFGGLSLEMAMGSIPIGIVLGLIVGKQVGIFGFSVVAIKLGLARMPEGINWLCMWAVSILCGIGFTMSLFIGSLAFEKCEKEEDVLVRIGVLAGSAVSAIMGFIVLKAGISRLGTTSADNDGEMPENQEHRT